MIETNKRAETIDAVAAEWLARRDGPDWNDARQAELDAWLAEDTRHRVAWLRLRSVWDRMDAVRGQQLAPAAHPQPLGRYSPWRIAAGVVLACALGAQLVTLTVGERGERYATRVGESRLVALADGSRVTLNTGTRLRATGDGERHVWLDEGEAYFDIAHDQKRPFVVEAGTNRITVLGTRFTVRREGGATRVLVAQGKVRVDQGAASVILLPDDEAVARKGSVDRRTHDAAHTGRALAWRDGRIVFDATPLAEAAAQFNRYNERQIIVEGPAAHSVVLGGSFAPTNVDGFVRLLEQGFGVRSERRGKDIVVTR